ncbi:MAG: RNA chaperone Hfq [Hyphomonadaceae bacterium]|nr:RNA chaperone Hfq [Hyphomonadaceae bacterium]
MKCLVKKQNLQDVFLGSVRKTRTPSAIFLISGVKLRGAMTWLDNCYVLLRRDGWVQLAHERAVSTIMPSGPVQLFDPEDDEDD